MRGKRGFTLLEILVVVSILAVLLLLLFPAFRFAKVQAARSRCLHNIKQITHALLEYSVLNGNKLPNGNPPWGAKTPNSPLNSYLQGDGFRVLECPADEGEVPGSEYSYFETQGYSYSFCGDGWSNGSQGISNCCGSVAWQEARLHELPKIDLQDVRNTLGYYSTGPEDEPNPNLRSRDITRDEIDNKAWPHIKGVLESMRGKEGFNINSDDFRWWRDITRPSPVPPQTGTQPKYTTEYNAADGMPIATGSRNSGRWNRPTPWSRYTYNIGYWVMSSKKVAALCRDGLNGFNTPGSNGTSANDLYPTKGMGFWHQYSYVKEPDPNDPTKTLYRVKVHAGFLDGHAAVIEMNKYSSIDRDGHDYY